MTVQEAIIKLGISPHLKGFVAIKRAIEILLDNKEVKMTYLYYEIGKEQNTSASNIERRMRFAIESGYSHMDKELKKVLFNNKGNIRNFEFLKVVTFAIENNLICKM